MQLFADRVQSQVTRPAGLAVRLGFKLVWAENKAVRPQNRLERNTVVGAIRESG